MYILNRNLPSLTKTCILLVVLLTPNTYSQYDTRDCSSLILQFSQAQNAVGLIVISIRCKQVPVPLFLIWIIHALNINHAFDNLFKWSLMSLCFLPEGVNANPKHCVKTSVFWIFLVLIFPHLDWIRRYGDTEHLSVSS